MIVLMSPSLDQKRRLLSSDEELPRWFGSPIMGAVSGTRFSRSFGKCLRAGYCKKGGELALVFNVGHLEATLACLPFVPLRLVSLHQWWPPEMVPVYKRWVYQRVLSRSVIILTYSRIDQQSLTQRFPGRQVRWIGHFVDTDYFDPQRAPQVWGDFILCPGDHKRVEHVVVGVAEALRVRVVRFTTDNSVLRFHEKHHSPYVECLSRISFGEVRQLYQSARLVMNAVDDRYWPVGITTFCEALAMDRPIITSAGHSCSGYQFDDSSRPYWTVQDPFDTEQWVALVREVLALNGQRLLGASPRELALKLCSFNASVNAWSDIHRHATQDS